jgi:hypothetical protein
VAPLGCSYPTQDAKLLQSAPAANVVLGTRSPPSQKSLFNGLYVILRLHTAQEDENYLSLGDGAMQTNGLASSILL